MTDELNRRLAWAEWRRALAERIGAAYPSPDAREVVALAGATVGALRVEARGLLIDDDHKCPRCGGTLGYQMGDGGYNPREPMVFTYKHTCPVCNLSGDWRSTRKAAAETLRPTDYARDYPTGLVHMEDDE